MAGRSPSSAPPATPASSSSGTAAVFSRTRRN